MLGLKKDSVKLVSHDKCWASFFEKEKTKLQKIFPDSQIEHIGSTAIPNIKAKPILDIMIALKQLKITEKENLELEKIGYENRGLKHDGEHIFLRKQKDLIQSVFVKLTTKETNFWKECFHFKESLLKDKLLAKKYEKIKEKIANSVGEENRIEYTKLKSGFIKKVLKCR